MSPFDNELWGSFRELFGSYNVGQGSYAQHKDVSGNMESVGTYNRPEATYLCAVGFVEASFGRVDTMLGGNGNTRNVSPERKAPYMKRCCISESEFHITPSSWDNYHFRPNYTHDYQLLEDLTIGAVLDVVRDELLATSQGTAVVASEAFDNQSISWLVEAWGDTTEPEIVKAFIKELDQNPIISKMRDILWDCKHSEDPEESARQVLDKVDGHLILHNQGTTSIHPDHITRIKESDIRNQWCDSGTLPVEEESYQAITYYQCYVLNQISQPVSEKYLIEV